jgi:outer membrane protein assembly factor BamB
VSSSFVGISYNIEKPGKSPEASSDGGLMDSAWPMYCHDVRHTGRSPCSTEYNNPGHEKWQFYCDDYVEGSAVIDNEGHIYFGSWNAFYALYPNGTMKWKYPIENF